MPKGKLREKPKAEAARGTVVAASEYRAAWWGPSRDEPSEETLDRVRRYVLREPDPDRLARFTAAEVAAACNLAVKVAHYDLEQLRAEAVLQRRREPIAGLSAAYVWALAHGETGVRQIGTTRAASDAVPLMDAARMLGVPEADVVTMVRNGVLAIDERASNTRVIVVRRADVARARWWMRHKDAPYAERHLPPVYVVPPAWAARLAALAGDQGKREGA